MRLVELLFNSSGATTNSPATSELAPLSAKSKPKRKPRAKSAQSKDDSGITKKKASSGGGAVATLVKIFEEGYFKQPRSIGDICNHCEINLARRIKPNEISGKLGRMVRSRELSRTKNSDNQYAYSNA